MPPTGDSAAERSNGLPCRPVVTPWRSTLADLGSSATRHLVLCAPFMSEDGTRTVLASRRGLTDLPGDSLLLTDLSSRAIASGSTDPRAILQLTRSVRGMAVVHLPSLHAKVYCADGRRAIVTSGNLTAGGLQGNFEYGLDIVLPALASRIERDLRDYAALGSPLDDGALQSVCDVAPGIARWFRGALRRASRGAERRLRAAMRASDDALLRARLGGGALHAVFARTIEYLLRHHGPLSTVSMHPMIQRIHPDLCDDTVDRVIDGVRFGKKWKHAVRTAQQQLKRRGVIRLAGGRWELA